MSARVEGPPEGRRRDGDVSSVPHLPMGGVTSGKLTH